MKIFFLKSHVIMFDWIFLNIHNFMRIKPFRNNKINLLMSWLENLYTLKNRSFNFSSNLRWLLLLQQKHLYSIESFLKFVYPRKHLQNLYLIPQVSYFLWSCSYLHLILWIPSEKLLTKFDKKIAINLVLSGKL